MAIGSTKLFEMTSGKLHWLGQRHRILAQNVANSNTPNYQAKDLRNLDFSSPFGSFQKTMHIARTDNKHFTRTENSPYHQYDTRYPHEVTPDGNGVSLEEQIFKLNAVQSEHNLATSIMRKYHAMYNQALTSPR